MRRVVLLVMSGIAIGAVLTAVAGLLPGSQGLNALSWLGTVATVAALVVAVGIYRVQQTQSDAAHQELLDALRAQDTILQDLAEATPPTEEPEASGPEPELVREPEPVSEPEPEPEPEPGPGPEPGPPSAATPRPRPGRGRFGRGMEEDVLTPEQRAAVEHQYPDQPIQAVWRVGDPARETRGRPRLVRLEDGSLLSVFQRGHGGGVQVRQVKAPRREGRPPRDRRGRGGGWEQR